MLQVQFRCLKKVRDSNVASGGPLNGQKTSYNVATWYSSTTERASMHFSSNASDWDWFRPARQPLTWMPGPLSSRSLSMGQASIPSSTFCEPLCKPLMGAKLRKVRSQRQQACLDQTRGYLDIRHIRNCDFEHGNPRLIWNSQDASELA